MAPVAPLSPPSPTTLLLPALWLLAATGFPSPRTRLTTLLTLLAVALALHPVLHRPPQPPTLHPLIRQVAPPETSPLPIGQPPPSPTPTRSPPPPPSAPPVPAEQPPATDGLQQRDVLLDECSGGLKRMQVVLLLELIFEVFFLFLRCFAEQELDDLPSPVDVNMRGYVCLRAVYVVPVLAINAGIYWVGGGPTGSCLSSFSAIQIPFVHLIFYAAYCVILVIIGVNRIYQYEKSYDSYPSDEYTDGPPTRTTSYFRSYGRRRRDESSSYEQPKFRINLGCCRFNF